MKLEWRQIITAFALGAIVTMSLESQHRPFRDHGRRMDPEKFQQRMMERFTTKLNLTSDQQQKVSVILSEARIKMQALHNEVAPRFEEVRNSVQAQIREILTADQKLKFEKMSIEDKARFGRRSHRFGYGGPTK